MCNEFWKMNEFIEFYIFDLIGSSKPNFHSVLDLNLISTTTVNRISLIFDSITKKSST